MNEPQREAALNEVLSRRGIVHMILRMELLELLSKVHEEAHAAGYTEAEFEFNTGER